MIEKHPYNSIQSKNNAKVYKSIVSQKKTHIPSNSFTHHRNHRKYKIHNIEITPEDGDYVRYEVGNNIDLGGLNKSLINGKSRKDLRNNIMDDQNFSSNKFTNEFLKANTKGNTDVNAFLMHRVSWLSNSKFQLWVNS